MKKKTFILAVATLFSIVSLAACGNKKQTNVTSNEPVTIDYWHVNADTQGGKTITQLVDNYNKSQDKVKVVAKFNPDMYKGLMQNLQSSIASNTIPDVVQVGWAFKDYFAENFQYTDPEELVKEVQPADADYFKENFLENIMNLAEKDGKYVGIPYSLSNPVLYLNQDILKAAGLDASGPKTWAELQTFAKTIKDKTEKYGVYIQEASDSWATQAIIESNEAATITNGKATFASKEGAQAYQLYQDMVVIDQSALHLPWEQGVQSFVDGNVGMLYTTIGQRNNIQNNATFDVTAVKSPKWGNKKVKLPAGGAMLAVTSQDAKKKKATWDFLKYLYSIESLATWTQGTGYVPPRKDVAASEKGLKQFLEENTMMTPAIEQMADTVSWTAFPGNAGLEAEQKLLDMRDKILSGSPTQKTLEETQTEINKLLE